MLNLGGENLSECLLLFFQFILISAYYPLKIISKQGLAVTYTVNAQAKTLYRRQWFTY